MQDKQVQSIAQVDMRELKAPMIAVYRTPDDYPQNYVARIFDGEHATNVVILKKTIGQIEEDIRKNTCMEFFQRGVEDVESLVGVWI